MTLDEVFGEIEFGRTFGLVGAGFWDGRVAFGPLKKAVKVRVVSGRKGPTDAQRAFFRELESNYDRLLDQIRPTLLYTPTRYWGSDFFGNFMPALDWKDFELDSIGIDGTKDAAREMEFVISILADERHLLGQFRRMGNYFRRARRLE